MSNFHGFYALLVPMFDRSVLQLVSVPAAMAAQHGTKLDNPFIFIVALFFTSTSQHCQTWQVLL